MSLKKTPAVPLVKTFNNALLLFQHIIHNVIIKANFKNHSFFFNIAVSWKRKPHTTPSNDLVANTCTCMHCYTESMQQGWTFWIAGAKLLHANRGQFTSP